MRILGLCGSLRASSINAALLRATARLAPPDVSVVIASSLGNLPLFNPDLESDIPATVMQLYTEVVAADALLFASPEYAHGVTGTIKNALDWLVGFEQFADKPVAVLNASPRAYHADTALRETLRIMSAKIIEPASITISLLGSALDEDAMVATPSIVADIHKSLSLLADAVRLEALVPKN